MSEIKRMSIDTIFTFLESCYQVCFDLIATPSKRTYFLYMLTSLPIVYFIYKKQKKTILPKIPFAQKSLVGKICICRLLFHCIQQHCENFTHCSLIYFWIQIGFPYHRIHEQMVWIRANSTFNV